MTSCIMSAPTSMGRGIDASSIPRYAQPTWQELDTEKMPCTGSCWNCGHAVELRINRRLAYDVCVAERDKNGSGDVFECDQDVTDCADWVDYEE